MLQSFRPGIAFCFVLQMYFSLPQLFVFLFDLLNVAVFVIRERFVKKRRRKKTEKRGKKGRKITHVKIFFKCFLMEFFLKINKNIIPMAHCTQRFPAHLPFVFSMVSYSNSPARGCSIRRKKFTARNWNWL